MKKISHKLAEQIMRERIRPGTHIIELGEADSVELALEFYNFEAYIGSSECPYDKVSFDDFVDELKSNMHNDFLIRRIKLKWFCGKETRFIKCITPIPPKPKKIEHSEEWQQGYEEGYADACVEESGDWD